MAHGDLLQSLLNDATPKNVRLLLARGSAPLAPKIMIEALVSLLSDKDQEIASSAARTLSGWDEQSVLEQLKSPDCPVRVLMHFANSGSSDYILQTIIRNPASSEEIVASIASFAPADLLEAILDNRMRLLKFPAILEKIKRNPVATAEILRLVQEIETEFFSAKKTEYAVEPTGRMETVADEAAELGIEAPPEDLTLEGLPTDPDVREAALSARLASLSYRDKMRYALFGTREIRAMLVRDSNREVARAVLRSPKITDSEVETIAAMRGVSVEILRDIGNNRGWIRSYAVVQNLVRNPKSPPVISQRLMSRLRSSDLMLLTKDKSLPEAVRINATRTVSQRGSKGVRQ